jgi:hypothetical protein
MKRHVLVLSALGLTTGMLATPEAGAVVVYTQDFETAVESSPGSGTGSIANWSVTGGYGSNTVDFGVTGSGSRAGYIEAHNYQGTPFAGAVSVLTGDTGVSVVAGMSYTVSF